MIGARLRCPECLNTGLSRDGRFCRCSVGTTLLRIRLVDNQNAMRVLQAAGQMPGDDGWRQRLYPGRTN